MPHDEEILGLKDYQIKKIQRVNREVCVWARYTGPTHCIHCGSKKLRLKDCFERQVRHESWGLRCCRLILESHKFCCQDCGKYFNRRFPGILPRRRSSEPFRRQVFWMHYDGIDRKTLARRQRVGSATIERWFQEFLGLQRSKMVAERCPRELGIDEHFFTRKQGFATTFCDLRHHKVYDVVLGRTETSLEGYLNRLQGKDQVELVCIDLSAGYRRLIQRHFPNARIVADRFHVIRLVNQHFLSAWRELDPVRSKHRGLLSLMRRHPEHLRPDQQDRLNAYFQEHPAIGAIYRFKQRLVRILRIKTRTLKQCRRLVPQLLNMIEELKRCGFKALEVLGRTLSSWSQEIAAMWRFSKNNGITEGFHNKMEMISRRAFGFRNFENYRLRVRVMCA